jgi:hypothetical protein
MSAPDVERSERHSFGMGASHSGGQYVRSRDHWSGQMLGHFWGYFLADFAEKKAYSNRILGNHHTYTKVEANGAILKAS